MIIKNKKIIFFKIHLLKYDKIETIYILRYIFFICKWKSAKWLSQRRQDFGKKILKVIKASMAR